MALFIDNKRNISVIKEKFLFFSAHNFLHIKITKSTETQKQRPFENIDFKTLFLNLDFAFIFNKVTTAINNNMETEHFILRTDYNITLTLSKTYNSLCLILKRVLSLA